MNTMLRYRPGLPLGRLAWCGVCGWVGIGGGCSAEVCGLESDDRLRDLLSCRQPVLVPIPVLHDVLILVSGALKTVEERLHGVAGGREAGIVREERDSVIRMNGIRATGVC